MLSLGKLPWTILKIIVKLNLIAVTVSIVVALTLNVFLYQTVNSNLQLFDKSLSSMNYIEPSVAELFMGRTNLSYKTGENAVFDNIVSAGGSGFYFTNTTDLINRNGRNYGDVVSYTFVVPIDIKLCTTFGVYEHTVNLSFRRAVPCLRRFKD